jgi:hypothetical protein
MESCPICRELAQRLIKAVGLLKRSQERTSPDGHLQLGR